MACHATRNKDSPIRKAKYYTKKGPDAEDPNNEKEYDSEDDDKENSKKHSKEDEEEEIKD